MCVIWTLLALALLVLAIFTWGVGEILIKAGLHDYPDVPDKIIEDAPPLERLGGVERRGKGCANGDG